MRDFEVEHEKRMHLIVVRRDGRGFQHVHPTLDRDGTWSVPLTLPEAGAYRVFADFEHDGEASTLAADLTVDGAVRVPRAARARGHGGRRPAGTRCGWTPARCGPVERSAWSSA